MKFSIYFILAYIHYSNEEAFIRRTHVAMIEGDTLINYYTFNTTNAIPTKCEVSYLENNVIVATALDLVSSKSLPYSTNMDNRVIAARIKPLLRNICGFTMSDYVQTDLKEFALIVHYMENGKNLVKNDTFTVQVATNNLETNTTIDVQLHGSTTTLACGSRNYGVMCALYHPLGHIVISGTTKCDFNFFSNPITITDIGTWRCTISSRNTMRVRHAYTTLRLPGPDRMITWYNESNGYGNVGCQYIPSKLPKPGEVPKWCQMTRPDGKAFTISDITGVIDRYTNIGTNYDEYICQIEFPLPIELYEIGAWMCNINDNFIYVMVKYNDIVDNNKIKKKLIVQLNKEAEITCEVNFNTDDCYLTTPQGVTYPGGTKNDFRAGHCKHTIKQVNETDLGEWQCHYAPPDAALYEKITVQVVLFDELHALTPTVELTTADEMTLLCSAQTAILNCAFMDPHGNTFHAVPDKYTPGYAYSGRGYYLGDCGIVISKPKTEDTGEWKCMVRLDLSDPELITKMYTDKIDVTVYTSGLTTASAIGISVGVIIAVGIIIGTIVFRKCRQKKQETVEGNVNEITLRDPLNATPRLIEINNDTVAVI